MTITLRETSPDEDEKLFAPIATAFGVTVNPERVARLRLLPELQMRIGAFDGDLLVGSAGSFAFSISTPGGAAVDTEGLTLVGVLTTHRRQGILRSMMRRHLDQVRARGKCLASLFASEGAIYGRFGYGKASLAASIELNRTRASFVDDTPPAGRFRFVSEDESAALLPPIWGRARAVVPGMPSRSDGWWRVRRLSDPEWARAGKFPLRRVVYEEDGTPRGYALYRNGMQEQHAVLVGTVDVVELIADSAAATRALWRYLCDVDLTQVVKAAMLPVDSPLYHLLVDPRSLAMRVNDALWLRIVDVADALSKRGWEASGPPLVFEVNDAFCPWNEGRYRLHEGRASRTADAADLVLDVATLGSTYFGGFGFTALAGAGLVVERTKGALRRADALFHSSRAPYCPEIF